MTTSVRASRWCNKSPNSHVPSRSGALAITQEVVYLLTDLPPVLAPPSQLLDLNRGHWSIENRLHYVRDVSFGEGRPCLRMGRAPQVLAALRNLAIILIHRQGSTQIAASRRHFASHPPPREAVPPCG